MYGYFNINQHNFLVFTTDTKSVNYNTISVSDEAIFPNLFTL